MITQQTFIIPPEIEAGLLNGDLKLWGGVVRNLSGKIVKHLEEVKVPAQAGESAAVSTASSNVRSWSGLAGDLKNPWLIIPAAVVGTLAAGSAVYVAVKKHRQAATAEVPEVVASYNTSLRGYLEAVREGRLSEEIIGKLISDLDAVVAYEEGGTISLDFSSKHVETLVGIVVDATKQLVEANDLDLDELQEQVPAEDDNVVDLRRYLEVQKRIFKDAG
ncbi:hypothetical protein [Alloactinosynnema sp. L-07]|uniref:hypothetical protein n=1 Tax=Alloactinosynnema sp. L-07 TaxID=1653480 RepID=UPI00065F02A5|nr:hypothetical protein [Alloactinosynnema sp. L-07]CRK59321.1 hypothetical protein [Alloactinosynnema sp. L-07]